MRVGRGSRGVTAWASASLSGAASLGLWAGFQDNNRDPAELVHGAVVLALGGVFFLAMLSFAVWLLIARLRVQREVPSQQPVKVPNFERLIAPGSESSSDGSSPSSERQ